MKNDEESRLDFIAPRIYPRDTIPFAVELRLSGPIADIPSLKNSKIPGTNFLNPATLSKLKALDYAWAVTPNRHWFRGFGDRKVFVGVVFRNRSRAFDTDNAFATVRDWLEPRSKKVGRGSARAWGIGLIENDSQVVGFGVKADELEIETRQTSIIVADWERFKGGLIPGFRQLLTLNGDW